MDKRETEEEEITYGCFRCGFIVQAPDDLIRPSSCEECGSPYMITYQESLDLLNELYLSKKFMPKVLVEDDESFIVDGIDEK